MQSRYENWVGGLNGDWLISRQRFFGVPFPLWYRLDASGEPVFDDPLLPDEADLPIDPTSDVPAGFTADQRNQPGGFAADPDIMDTWATSSLSPQIAGGWEDDPDLFARVFPFDLRPQGHDIIRTWLFSTVVRSHHEHGSLPWTDAALSGWILDPDRKKMSKSVGNVVTPLGLLEQHGTDAVRYWAANGRLGTDTAFDEGQMKVGRRLAVKLLNASKFALGFPEAEPGPVTEPSTARCSAGWPTSSTRPPPPSRPRTTPARSSAPRRSSGRTATTTSSWSRAGRTARPRGRRLGEPRAADVARRAAAAVRAGAALRHRGGLVLVAGRLGARAALAASASAARGQRHAPSARGERPQDVLDVAAAVLERVRGEKSRAKTSMKTPVLACAPPARRRAGPAAPGGRGPAQRLPHRRLHREAADGPFAVASDRAGRGAAQAGQPPPSSPPPSSPRRDAPAGPVRAGHPLPGRGQDGPGPRPDLAALRPARLAEPRVPGDPPDRHQRQEQHRRMVDALLQGFGLRPAATPARTSTRSPSGSSSTGSRSPRTASSRRGTSWRRTSRWSTSVAGADDLLRGAHRDGLLGLRRRTGRRRGARGRPRRGLGRDQRRGGRHRRGAARGARPRAAARHHAGRDRH
jgi:hypothetical protein